MRLPSIFSDIKIAYSVNKAARSPENKPAAVAAQFAAWEQSVTTDEVRKAILASSTDVDDQDLYADVTHEELECLRFISSKLITGTDGQLKMDSIMHQLAQVHEESNSALHSNKTTLEHLLTSHTAFPFPEPVILTPDELCRSIFLLTNRCESSFKQAIGTGDHEVVRTRDSSARLRYIFSSLTQPPSGAPPNEDVLDVLYRVRYPA